MAKPKKAMAGGGPHLSAALFCEKFLQEKDGAPTLVRVVDVLTVPRPEPQPIGPEGWPEPMPSTLTTVVIVLKSGDARGQYRVRLNTVFPSGRVRQGREQPVEFLGDEKGINLYGIVPVPIIEEGLYWYDLLVNGRRQTRIPLRIVYGKPTPEAQPKPTAEYEVMDSPPSDRQTRPPSPSNTSASGRKRARK
jgi:hypothetical protein